VSEPAEADAASDDDEYVGVQGAYAGTPIPPIVGSALRQSAGANRMGRSATPTAPPYQRWAGGFPMPQTGSSTPPGPQALLNNKKAMDAGSPTTQTTVTAVYTWGAAGLVSENISWLASTGNPGSLFYAYYPNGATLALTDINGAGQDVYLNSAYGEQWDYFGAGDPNPFQFGGQAGYYTDQWSTLGFTLCGARWYVPNAGFWLSRDPAGYAGGPNLYAYCDDNPVLWLDPDGLDGSGPNAVEKQEIQDAISMIASSGFRYQEGSRVITGKGIADFLRRKLKAGKVFVYSDDSAGAATAYVEIWPWTTQGNVAVNLNRKRCLDAHYDPATATRHYDLVALSGTLVHEFVHAHLQGFNLSIDAWNWQEDEPRGIQLHYLQAIREMDAGDVGHVNEDNLVIEEFFPPESGRQ
jgi:RHS repeat-associated protein